MGRYSPTVIAQPGPSFAEGLADAASSFVGMQDRKRQIARQQVADSQTAGRYNADMAQAGQNLEAGEQNIENSRTQGDIAATNLQLTRGTLAAQPFEQAADLRSKGYTPDANGGFKFDASLAPLTPTQQFANQLTLMGKQQGFQHGENVYTQGALNARDAANNAARLKEYQMMSDGRLFRYGAVMGPDGTPIPAPGPNGESFNGGATAAQLNGMSPSSRQKHFNDVAQNAVRSADAQLPANDANGNVSLNGRSLPRAAARQQLAAQLITQDPSTANYFSYGMNTDHILAADQRFGERPAARAGKGKLNADQAMAILRGQAPVPGAPAAGAPPAGGPPSPANAANAANGGGRVPVEQADAQLRAQGIKAPERRAKLKAMGYNVQ